MDKRMNQQIEPLQEIVVNILNKNLGVPVSMLSSDYWDMPLTGEFMRLSAVDLTYLFFEIEKRCNVQIDGKHLDSYGFNSVNKVVEIVLKCSQMT
jgi:hypothetical protein